MKVWTCETKSDEIQSDTSSMNTNHVDTAQTSDFISLVLSSAKNRPFKNEKVLPIQNHQYIKKQKKSTTQSTKD